MSQSRHSKYYLEDQMTVFLVEGRLFKVHRHFLNRDSSVFQGMFACPTPPESVAEGGSDDNPILLPDVPCEEFEVLLDFFYDRTYEQGALSMHDLITLLSISTRFDFEKARQFAINSIGKLNLRPIDCILLAERYDVVQWLRPAYIALCRRPGFLEVEEAKELGFEKTVLLAKAREMRSHHQWSRSVDEIGIVVDKIFFPPHDNANT